MRLEGTGGVGGGGIQHKLHAQTLLHNFQACRVFQEKPSLEKKHPRNPY